jgi:hypothetical protein
VSVDDSLRRVDKAMDEMCKRKNCLHIIAHNFTHTSPTDADYLISITDFLFFLENLTLKLGCEILGGVG